MHPAGWLWPLWGVCEPMGVRNTRTRRSHRVTRCVFEAHCSSSFALGVPVFDMHGQQSLSDFNSS